MKQIHIIAGLRWSGRIRADRGGAGKSSFARVSLLPQFLRSNEFVNANDSVPKKDIKKYVFIVDKKTSRIKKYSLKTWDSSILSDINKKKFFYD